MPFVPDPLKSPDELTHDDLEPYDLDWYAIDENGNIGHFATNDRGPIPKSITKSDLSKTKVYFYKIAPSLCNAIESSDWLKYAKVNISDDYPKNNYLWSFSKMSKKGIYSYDMLKNWDDPLTYFRVTIPEKPITCDDLPEDIQYIISKTRFNNVSFNRDIKITPEDLGDYVV